MKGWSTRNNNFGLMLIGGIITIQWAKNWKKECKPERFKNQLCILPHIACRPLETTKMFPKKIITKNV